MWFIRPRILWHGSASAMVSNCCLDDVFRPQEFEVDRTRTVHYGIGYQFAHHQLGSGEDPLLAVTKIGTNETSGERRSIGICL